MVDVPVCLCVRKVLRIIDPSGNEREELPVGVPGWRFFTEVLPGPEHPHDHQSKCPITRWVPPFPELPAKAGRSHVGNGAYKGPFAYTLTMSPQWGLTTADMIKAAQKLMAQKSQKIAKYAWYLEYGKPETAEHPHIHGMYETETGRRLEMKHFKRMWTDKWDETKPMGQGFVGGYHRPVKADEAYSKYIKKQGGVGESSDNI